MQLDSCRDNPLCSVDSEINLLQQVLLEVSNCGCQTACIFTTKTLTFTLILLTSISILMISKCKSCKKIFKNYSTGWALQIVRTCEIKFSLFFPPSSEEE